MKEEWELNNQEQKQIQGDTFQMWSKDKFACVRHGSSIQSEIYVKNVFGA